MATITEKIRKLVQHIGSFRSKASVLYDELKELISFELLIDPLNSILNELKNNGIASQGISAASFQISSNEAKLSSNTIEILKERLSSLPLTDAESNTC